MLIWTLLDFPISYKDSLKLVFKFTFRLFKKIKFNHFEISQLFSNEQVSTCVVWRKLILQKTKWTQLRNIQNTGFIAKMPLLHRWSIQEAVDCRNSGKFLKKSFDNQRLFSDFLWKDQRLLNIWNFTIIFDFCKNSLKFQMFKFLSLILL